MEKVILYTMPAAQDATEHTVLRLTVGVVNALGMARYRRLVREFSIWLRDACGVDVDDEGAMSPEEGDLLDVGYRRGYMLGALKKIERGTCAPDDDVPTEWQPAKLPAEWETIEGFIEQMPVTLFEQWDAAALTCNPDTFFVRLDDEKKRKPGGVTVI